MANQTYDILHDRASCSNKVFYPKIGKYRVRVESHASSYRPSKKILTAFGWCVLAGMNFIGAAIIYSWR